MATPDFEFGKTMVVDGFAAYYKLPKYSELLQMLNEIMVTHENNCDYGKEVYAKACDLFDQVEKVRKGE